MLHVQCTFVVNYTEVYSIVLCTCTELLSLTVLLNEPTPSLSIVWTILSQRLM